MNVLRVITRMNGGGPARQVAYLHQALEASGHKSKVIHGQLAANEADFSSLFHDTTYTQKLSCLSREISLFKDLASVLCILFELCRGDYHLIHTHTAKAGLCGRVAAWIYSPIAALLGKPKLKVVHTFHGHVFSGYFDQGTEDKVKKMERFLWRLSDVTIALTHKLKSEIIEHLGADPSKMQVVPLGIDLAPYLEVVRDDVFNAHFQVQKQKWVGWVGRLEPIKNPKKFLDWAKAWSAIEPDTGFVLVGDGGMKSELESAILSEGLEDVVFLYGWSDNLQQVYSGLDVLANTSDNEGTPVAVLEAMASGLKIVATDVGGVSETLSSYDSDNYALLMTEKMFFEDSIILRLNKSEKVPRGQRQDVVDAYSPSRLKSELLSLYQNS